MPPQATPLSEASNRGLAGGRRPSLLLWLSFVVSGALLLATASAPSRRMVRILLGGMCCALAFGVPAVAKEPAWPKDLEGPFTLDRYEQLRMTMDDGVVLDGVAAIPKLPEGVRAPVVLQISPYHAALDPAGDEDDQQGGRPIVVPRDELIREGYAVAYVNVRGTGASGGCFNFFGAREQSDSHKVVEDLASRPWSNGHVATIGVSYDGTTAFQPAVSQAQGLEAVVAAGLATDLYGILFSPQGAAYDDQWAALAGFYAAVTNVPRRSPQENQLQLLLDQLAATQALCPDVADWMLNSSASAALPARSEAFFAERDILSRFHQVRAAVLIGQGFRDHIAFSEDTAFAALVNAQRYQLSGPWTHRLPPLADWNDRLVRFFDIFLKGRGKTPSEGVEFFDTAGTRHVDAAWPPKKATEQALPLAGARSFRTLPDTAYAETSIAPNQDIDGNPSEAPYAPRPPCPTAEDSTSLTYLTPPASEDTVIAGNPRALVRIASDQSQGVFVLRLFRVRKSYNCSDTSTFDYMGTGAVDLQHHGGNLAPWPFPVGVPLPVRVDIQNLAFALDPGDRVAAVVEHGPFKTNATDTGTTLTIHGGELVLPVLQGGFGLDRPRETYPARPRSGISP